jgi:Putative zinc-finger
MDELDACAATRDLLPQLATGAVCGDDRARVLRHISRCPACRVELTELSRTADELLLLAPEREPPAGFETTVLAKVTEAAAPARLSGVRARIARIALWAAVLLVALPMVGTLGAGAALWRTAPDRDLGERYRRTLAIANGQYLRAARITAEAGGDVGQLFAYQGHPSWIFVTVTSAPRPGTYRVRLVTKDGRELGLGECVVTSGTCAAGGAIDVRVSNIRLVDLTMPEGPRLTAQLTG